MKLYRIYRPDNLPIDWDQYDEAVVAAKNEQEARRIHPAGASGGSARSWIPAEHVLIEYLGTAKPGTKAGVICASGING